MVSAKACQLALWAGLLASLSDSPAICRAQTPAPASVTERIALVAGQAAVIDELAEIQRVAIAEDQVADAVPVTGRELLVQAKSPGITTLVVWSRAGQRKFFEVEVSPNVRQLQQHINATFPGESIRVLSSDGVISLVGKASSPKVAEAAAGMAQGFKQARGAR